MFRGMFTFRGKASGEEKSDGKQDSPKGICGRGTEKGGCGPRERIARVEAGLVLLDSFAEDKSALAFDWGNSDSVAHESQRNALRNTLVADISDRCSDRSPRQGVTARLRTRSFEDQCAEYAENLLTSAATPTTYRLNEAATPLQHRCSSSRTSPPKRASSSGGTILNQEPRRVSLMFWPPEFIPSSSRATRSSSSLESKINLDTYPVLEHSPHGASGVGPLRTNRVVSAAALLLESRDRARAVVVPHLEGILVNRDTPPAVSYRDTSSAVSGLQPIRGFACWSWRQSSEKHTPDMLLGPPNHSRMLEHTHLCCSRASGFSDSRRDDVKRARRPSVEDLILDTILSSGIL